MLSVGTLCEPDEFAGDPVGVRGENQFLAGAAEHLAQWCDDDRDVAHHDHQVVVGPFDQQAAVHGLGRLLGHGGQQHGLAAGAGPFKTGGGLAGDADVEIGGHVADQRGFDAAEHAVLRPVQLGCGLFDGKQRGRERQQRSEQPCDHGNDPRGPVLRARVTHGPRW